VTHRKQRERAGSGERSGADPLAAMHPHSVLDSCIGTDASWTDAPLSLPACVCCCSILLAMGAHTAVQLQQLRQSDAAFCPRLPLPLAAASAGAAVPHSPSASLPLWSRRLLVPTGATAAAAAAAFLALAAWRLLSRAQSQSQSSSQSRRL
jgi:hypothetical protein